MNTFIGFGHVTKDAETKTVNVKGVPTLVTNFTVAVNDGYGDTETTAYIRCTMWRDRGARLSQYLKEGRAVSIRGAIGATAWIGNDGKARADLTLMNPTVELIGKSQKAEAAPAPEVADELPFDD